MAKWVLIVFFKLPATYTYSTGVTMQEFYDMEHCEKARQAVMYTLKRDDALCMEK